MSIDNVVPFAFAKTKADGPAGANPVQAYSYTVQTCEQEHLQDTAAETYVWAVKAAASRIFLRSIDRKDHEDLLVEWHDVFVALYTAPRDGLNAGGLAELNAFMRHAVNLNSVVR